MLFFLKMENKEYEIEVQESALEWTVLFKHLKLEKTYNIPKKNLQQFGEVLSFIFKNRSYLIDIIPKGDHYTVFTKGAHRNIQILTEEKMLYNKGGESEGGGLNIKSGMPGKITAVKIKAGDQVKEGDVLLIIEAMKMENEIRAGKAGVIKQVYVKAGDSVEAGALLLS